MMTADRRKLQRELADDLRKKDRAALELLREQVTAAKAERKQLLRGARESCSTARAELKRRQAVERAEFVQRQRAARLVERGACKHGKDEARARGVALEAGARRTLKDERVFRDQVRRAGKPKRERSTARERAQEDDDRVRSNLPPELVPVFDKVARRIKGTAKRSRTEAFLDWAEENPDEILSVQQAAADADLRALMKQQREMGRTVRSAKRYKQTPEQLAELLAGVPF